MIYFEQVNENSILFSIFCHPDTLYTGINHIKKDKIGGEKNENVPLL